MKYTIIMALSLLAFLLGLSVFAEGKTIYINLDDGTLYVVTDKKPPTEMKKNDREKFIMPGAEPKPDDEKPTDDSKKPDVPKAPTEPTQPTKS